MWTSLYTYYVTRALHLYIVTDLTAEAFPRSFARFTARRGLPSKIVSDNGSAFKSASRQIVDLMKSLVVRQYLAEKNVQWIFNL